MRIALLTICTLLLVAAGARALPPASGWSAVISVDSVMAEPGDHVGVPVRMTGNDQAITSIRIPLKLESPYLSIDSVSFVGSLLTSEFGGLVYISDTDDTAKITYSPLFPDPGDPLPTISASSGILATLWITVSPAIGPGAVPIDSLSIDSLIDDGSGVRIWEQVHAADTSGIGVLLPSFVPGAVSVDISLDIDDDADVLPKSFNLAQNYPNPFNPTTTIEFALPTAGEVKLAVYNVLGQEVVVLVDGFRSAGTHRVEFEAANKPSGIYFYRLEHAEGVQTRKMTLLK